MAFRAWYSADAFSERTGDGWFGGIPSPFDIGGWIWDWFDPFPSGSGYPQQIPAPQLPVVISEIPSVPEGWETVIIGGEERIVVPDEYGGATQDPLSPGPLSGLPPEEIGRVWDETTPAQDDTEEPMAHDWGHLARQFLGDVINPSAPALPSGISPTTTLIDYTTPTVTPRVSSSADGCDGMAWSGGAPPKGYKVVNYCGQGVLRKVRRRRRRRLLTASDSRDIATIVGLVGKGQMASALINRR